MPHTVGVTLVWVSGTTLALSVVPEQNEAS
jgi:hypothetical protein